uniref:Uncharacterized protein n=1 Tax=Eutreptiella gymnastica TaxID=73025 RepID=A0A7S4FGK4_9EUGL
MGVQGPGQDSGAQRQLCTTHGSTSCSDCWCRGRGISHCRWKCHTGHAVLVPSLEAPRQAVLVPQQQIAPPLDSDLAVRYAQVSRSRCAPPVHFSHSAGLQAPVQGVSKHFF